MDKDQIAKKLRLVRPQLSPEARQAIAADIYYSGEPETVLADLNLVDKLISSYHEKIASKGGNRAVAARDPNTCPECQLPMKPVLLADDRPAKYCPKHFVVFPCKQESK
jgi:hypothetical protein